MTHPLLTVSQLDSLIQIVDINSHTEWTTVQIQISWLLVNRANPDELAFFRNQLIWIYTVCKGRAYPGSAGLGLNDKYIKVKYNTHAFISLFTDTFVVN